ncbi:MAG: hypothetical protein U1F36_06135 [Planctomycetota bacterium]
MPTRLHSRPFRRILPLAALLLSACGNRDAEPAPHPVTPAAPQQPIDVDFGTVPHGDQCDLKIDVPIPEAGGPWTPLTLNRSCTCVSHEFRVRDKDGNARSVASDGRVDPVGAIRPGETLELHLHLDTREKEATDLEPVWTPAQVVLQGPSPSFARQYVPVRFRFGIHAPLQLTPSAHLALGDLPRPLRYEQSLQIHRRGQKVIFGKPEIVEVGPEGLLHHPNDIEVTLDGDAEPALLTVAVKPSDSRAEGPIQGSIRIPTDLPGGYLLRIPLSAVVVGAIEVEPPGMFSFGRIDMTEPRETRLRVVDHDLARSADFVVVGVLSDEGKDLASAFEVEIEAVEGRPRDRIISFRYLGHLDTRSFRGEVQLAKAKDEPSLIRIPFVGFANR